MEEELHIKRNNFITIVDINIVFLTKLDYTKIIKEEGNSLERLLYIFVCNNKEKLDKLYLNNDIMDKVRDKMDRLTKDFDDLLYYNYDEHLEKVSLEVGEQRKAKEIAKIMLEDNIKIESIMKYTGLSKEEIESLKK